MPTPANETPDNKMVRIANRTRSVLTPADSLEYAVGSTYVLIGYRNIPGNEGIVVVISSAAGPPVTTIVRADRFAEMLRSAIAAEQGARL